MNDCLHAFEMRYGEFEKQGNAPGPKAQALHIWHEVTMMPVEVGHMKNLNYI
jgi:hypothetical protein